MINRKRTVRYPGTDVRDWKVVTYSGRELSRSERQKTQDGYKDVLVRRWNGFKTANHAARQLGGVAVRV